MADIFVITSVIHVGSTPWSYTPTRSIFTPEQRFTQTVGTIESVRRYCPGAKILLVEASCLEPTQTAIFESLCDYVHNVNALENTDKYCLNSSKKGLGDAWLFQQGLEYIVRLGLTPRVIFKMSGRYWLTEKFDRAVISEEIPTFRQTSAASYITFCFAIPGSLCKTGIEIMKRTVAMYNGPKNPSLEDYLPIQFQHRKAVSCIGAAGQIAVDSSLSIYSV